MNLIHLISSETKCTEQWTQINLEKNSWNIVGDANIEDSSSSDSYSIQFYPHSTLEENINYGGAIWNTQNLSGKKGILISFKPSIIIDTAYYGNVKYPQGFAIVLTSSSISNLIGNKGSGIGYDGINNGIAFEFDFIRQSDKGDSRKPHFSIHYNLNGEISSSEKDCKDICNIDLPNFYDNTNDGYKKNMIFEIEIIGKKLSVKTNTGKFLLNKYIFEPFSKLLEQEEVFIGITASMNLNKKVNIDDFSLTEISIKEKGELFLNNTIYMAGETISLFFSIKSTCGEFLKIYPNEYNKNIENNNTNLILIINNKEEDSDNIIYTFDEKKNNLQLDISRIKTGTYTALVKFRNNYSSPVQFKVQHGNVKRFEICNKEESVINGIYINSNVEKDVDSFNISVCSYDQYNNSRDIDRIGAKNFIKILYPKYFTGNNDLIPFFIGNSIEYKIPFSTFGEYIFFNESFIQNSKRIYDYKVSRISSEKSEVTILYGKHLINLNKTKNVTLRLKLRDEFGREIQNDIIEKMNCNFSGSYIEGEDFISSDIIIKNEINDIIYLIYEFTELKDGKYTFIPKIQCVDDENNLTLKCSETEDDETIIYDKCAFYINSGKKEIKENKIRLYSDFLNDYIYFDMEHDENPELLISLDEEDNKKITEINLLDNSDYPMTDPTNISIISSINNNINLTAIKVGYSIALLLEGSNSRKEFEINKIYILNITINSKIFNIRLKFVSVDKILNNMIESSNNSKIIAFYQQENYTIEASENILLFEIFEFDSDNYYLIKDTSIKNINFKIIINDEVDKNAILINKEYSVLVSTNSLIKEGIYKINIENNNKKVFEKDLEIIIIPFGEAEKIVDENNQEKENYEITERYKYFILYDKYDNIIKDNKAILAFSKFEINSNGLKAQINIDGKLFIFPEDNSINNKTIEIILPSGKKYCIFKKPSEDEPEINHQKTYGLMESSTNIYANSTISLNIYLFNNNGKEINSSKLESEIQNFTVYAIEKFGNNKKFFSLDGHVSKDNINTFNFNTRISSVGEYEIKIFYNNLYISCKACHFVIFTNNIIDFQKTRLFILGNKRKIPVFSENIQNSQFLLNSKNFIFYLQFYDYFYNEATSSTQYSLTLYHAEKKNDLNVKLCHYGNTKNEGKQFYHVCSDQLNKFKSLIDGEYRIEVNGKVFCFYVSNTEYDKLEEPIKAIYHQYENETYGTTDSVISLIIDLRSKNNKRINLNKRNIDKISIKLLDQNLDLVQSYYNYNIILGPDNGLFTLILNIKKTGKYYIDVYYDNKKLISRKIEIYISCGLINKLHEIQEEINYYNSVGPYALFKISDINNEECDIYVNNSWNIFNNEYYIQNLIKAKDKNNTEEQIYYSTTNYYNHMTGVLSIMINREIKNDITLSSDLFDFEYEISPIKLIKEKLNKEYIYVNLDQTNHKVKLSILKKNYEPYPDNNIFALENDDLLTLIVLKYINDETTLIDEIKFNNNFEAEYNDSILKSPGDYFFIVYLNGEEVPCGECYIKNKNDKNISIKKTKVYLKYGYNKYLEGNENIMNFIYKSRFPFYKINFRNDDNNIIKLSKTDINSKYKIKLIDRNSNELATSLEINDYNGNIYIYLNDDGRKNYLKLSDKNERIIKLIIQDNSNNEIRFEYILFSDYSTNNEKIYEKCNLGAQPVIVDIQPTYIIRANEFKEIEVYLEGCSDLINNFDATFEIITQNFTIPIINTIPADNYGNYILLINYDKVINNPIKAFLKYKNGASQIFKISVLPGYDIDTEKIKLYKDKDLGEANVNYKYNYILMEINDKKDNLITNVGRNLFFNDINILKISDSHDYHLPYKISFDEDKNMFRVEIPISGNGEIHITDINNKKLDFELNINESKIYHNINFKMIENEDNSYNFNMNFLDDFYKKIEIPHYFSIEDLSLIYVTENFATHELYSIIFPSNKFNYSEENKEINLKMDENIPKYDTFTFVPIVEGFTQICYNCIKRNDYTNYIFSIHNNLYYPHNLDKEINLNLKYEYPIFIYFSNINIDIETNPSYIVKKNNITNNSNYYYILGITNNEIKKENILVKFNNKIKLNITFIMEKSEAYTKEMTIKMEKYYYNYIFFISGNNGKLLDLYFYIDIRNNANLNSVLISNEYTSKLLSGKSENKTLIEYLNIFQTEINGTYIVIIPNNKLINGKYTINFIENNQLANNNNLNTIVFSSFGSFPNQMLLTNKEMIYKNMIKYDLIGQNENSEFICDERLNIYIEPKSSSKFIKGEYVNVENNELNIKSCKLFIKFIGDIDIKTNIGNGFLSELTNSDNSIYNINPHYSKLIISPNIIIFGNETEEIEIKFDERSSDDLSFSEDEMPVNKGLKSLRYITSTKYEVKQDINGLYSSKYIFSPSQFKISKLDTYIFIGYISNNNIENPVFISYIKKKGKTPQAFNIKYYEEKIWTSIDNILTQNKGTSNSLSFKYPFKLSVKLVDKYGSLIKALNDKLNVSIISLPENKVHYNFPLEIKQINDYEFIIEPNISNIDNLIHMETKNQNSKFFIMFVYDNLEYYAYLSSRNENHLHPRISKKGYGTPKKIFNDEDYELVNEYENENEFYIIPDEPNSEIYCLVKDELLFNGNIDPNKIECKTEDNQNCKNINIINSYRGCIKIGIKNKTEEKIILRYSGISLATHISIIPFSNSEFNFDLSIPKKNNITQNENYFNYRFKVNDENMKNSKHFSVYLNGQKLNKSEYIYSFSKDEREINIKVILLLSTLYPKKNINVIYNRGKLESEYNIGEIKLNILQNPYSYSDSAFKYSSQVPAEFKAGEKPFFYLIIKDSNKACYYGDENRLENLKNITGELKETSLKKINFIIDSYHEMENVPTCQYIYKLVADNSITKSGLFNIVIKDGNIEITSNLFEVQIYISPSEFSKSRLIINNGIDTDIYAGDTFNLIFTTKDEYDNEPNYYDIVEHFEIRLINSETNALLNETSIKYQKIKVINNTININMSIIESGEFYTEIYYKNNKLKLNSQIIRINHKDCSFNNPVINLTKIDNRNDTFYSGEVVEINIYCRDQYNNLIKRAGSESFKAIINNNGKLITSENKFIDGHKIYFTTENDGNYIIQIYLNGKKYFGDIKIKVENFNETLFMCMNKKQVENLKECLNETDYGKLIEDIEGTENICKNSEFYQEGEVFQCLIQGELKCTFNTSYCDCEENFTNINGYCYPDKINPIDLTKENKNKINCLTILKGKGISNAVQCPDGSCRLNEEDCKTVFECPLGFKSCGNKCILLYEKCDIQNQCGNEDVLCWDYSCAKTYSLCPTRKTCSNGKILCPDGTCQNSGHCAQPISRKCINKNQYQCPDFSCVENKNDCKKNKVCPIGQNLCEDDKCRDRCQNIDNKKYKCSNGDYVENSQLCPSEMQCPNTWIKCPQGGCAKSQEGCKYVQAYKTFVCPKNRPILCPDFECVLTFDLCNLNYPICPPHKPYQCWNNECRRSFDECPTEISCPQSAPLLCNNGLCVSSINNCQDNQNAEDQLPSTKDKKESNLIRCFDGSYVSSIELCPTQSYCGKNIIKCWNGACVDSLKNCESTDSLTQCSGDFIYRCPDGTCRKNKQSCSTISVCPFSLPIKCFDNSCRATIEECPDYHSCGINKVSCPDGTCAKSYDECNTIVTCDLERPFLCYDGTCRSQLDDCPIPPFCDKNNVQCPDGSCVISRQYCKLFNNCEAKTPIRCEMNICSDSLNNCLNINDRECSIGYARCPNGDCKIMSSLCEETSCPSNSPYKCPEGVCVSDKKYCDKENGCPYSSPIKCIDGTCVEEYSLCKEYKNITYCPDGSTKNDKGECPLINGCPKNKALKCADGTCVDPNISECPPVYCPRDKPIKCLNGLCVKKSGDCHSIPNNADLIKTKINEIIMCIDGKKVPSYDYCRPMFVCAEPNEKCNDFTCRPKESCPESIQCPKERPYRTNDNNICSTDESSSHSYCPTNCSKCEYTGECFEDISFSSKCVSPNYQNGCPKENQTRCDIGRCLNSENECQLSNKACPDDESPFLCNNGECVSNLDNCADEDCGEGFIICYNGRCVENNEESYMNKCTNEIGCPINTPYRCSNGKCASSERNCEIFTEDKNKIILNTICDTSKPYLCSDYSCESDYKFCKITMKCPEGYIKCYNGYCIEKDENCNNYKNYCPQSNPIRCPSGSCTTNILKCPDSSPKESCKEGEFYCVRLGKCLKKMSECLLMNQRALLNKNILILSLDSGVLCNDGTFAKIGEYCPIVQSCKIGQYRCENGACAYDKNECIIDDDYKCENEEKKCPDGLCHKNCEEVAYQGCLVGEYLCSNGMCVKSELECVGYSMCEDPSIPYRCISGECKSDITLCPEVERISDVKNISYSFNKDNIIEFNFAFDKKGRCVGKLIIPSKGIKLNKKYSKINIGEFSTSLIFNNSLYNNTPEFLYNVSNGIEGSEGVLTFENSIMSTVFKFYSEELPEINFDFPALLALEHNYYISPSFYYYDYCLAKLSNFDMKNNKLNYGGNSKWECIQRLEKEEQKEFTLNEFGVYTIILNPLRDKINFSKGETKNFILDNIKYILIIIVVLIILIFGTYYIFSRIIRYRGKYHENRAKIDRLKQQKEEYKQMQTDVFGQSLGDNLIGIVYAKNPGFNEEDEEMKNVGGLENEIEEIQRKCRNMEIQNEKLKDNLKNLGNEYQKVNAEIEQIKNNNN